MEEVASGQQELSEVRTEDLSHGTPEQVMKKIVEILDSKKAHDIRVLAVEKQTVIADYFVLCTANSSTQVQSLSGEVDYKMGLCGRAPAHVDGVGGDKWTVLDFSSVIVHVFIREAREFYNLDKLWEDTREYSADSEA